MRESVLARDVRQAVRSLRRTPSFVLGAVLTVALTVGATTAMWSVVYGVLLRQLPYRDVDRLYWIYSDQPGRDRTPFNVPDFVDYRDSARTLSGFAGFFAYGANLSDEAAAERAQGIQATGNLFDVLGARARLGRLLQPGDERPDAGRVVVLAEPLWSRRFGRDPAIVGRRIRLNGEEHEVVGVLGSDFVLPVRDVELVVPFAPDRDPRRGARNSLNFVHGVGRLAKDASRAQAASEMNGIARRLQERFPVENARKRGVRMLAAVDGLVGPFRTALLTLLAAVGAVLLVACANLANLMLTRATSRRQELAVRLALGSPRGHVARMVLVEAALLGVSGGLLGAWLAWWGVGALVALVPTQLPRASQIRVDGAVLLFSLVVSLLTAALFGVLPALASARVDVRDALQEGGRGATGGGRRVLGALVATEVALAVVLLASVTLLAKSFANVQSVAPGFDATGVLSARLTLPTRRFDSMERIAAFQATLAERLKALPTVTGTGAVSLLPLSGLLWRVPFTVAGRTVERESVPLAQYRTVTAGYFEAAGIPLKRGRTFSGRDTEETSAAAVVSEALAEKWLAGMEPIGARLLIDDNDGSPRPLEIVGVVGNVQQASLEAAPTWDLYLPYPQVHPDNVGSAAANMFWIVRTTGDAMSLGPAVAREVRRLDPEIAASQIRPMDRYLSDALAPRRFGLSLMAAFAMAALALAATGVYAVVAYSTSLRARELAIRSALGARPGDILRLVLRQGALPAIAGIGVGLAGAFAATRTLSGLLFGLSPVDPATFAVVPACLILVTLAACLGPGLRASRAAASGTDVRT